jgi:hypothetical protein
MPSVTHPRSAVSPLPPLPTAALLLAARGHLSRLRLPHPTARQILTATGASRSRAYELKDAILSTLPALERPVGRPRAEPSPRVDTTSITDQVLGFVMQHPGCVHSKAQRQRYSDAFRCFVLELCELQRQTPLDAFAVAVHVPPGTLKDWLRGGRQDVDQPAPSATTASTDQVTSGRVEAVIAEWRSWEGDFGAFCEHLSLNLRIPFGHTLIASILEQHGERTPRRRSGRSPDEKALRKAFETFFPGAQWVGDGSPIVVQIGEQRFRFNLELMVDAHSDAAVGASTRDEEDSQAVVEAFDDGVRTTGAPSLCTLLDNRSSNLTPEVHEGLDPSMVMHATKGRPQNKAHVEGAFGLFAQTIPPIELSTHDPHELAKTVVLLLATIFFRVLNHRPRRDRDGMTRAQLYAQDVTPQQREAALASLTERMRKQQLAHETRAARTDPVVRGLLDDAFDRLGLIDPEHHFRDAIACYPFDAVVDAVAIFVGKRIAGTLPEGVDARYLLGIVRNVHHRHESEAITDALLRERIAARDRLLQPLVHERDAILVDTAGDTSVTIDAIVDRLTRAERIVDRHFWLDAAVAVFPTDDGQRVPLFRRAARRIHAACRVPPRERYALERSLIRSIWPLS